MVQWVTAVIGGGLHFGENFEVHFGDGCMRNMQWNIDAITNSTFALEPAQENLWKIFDRRPWVLLKSLACPHECVVFHWLSKQKSDDLLHFRVICFILETGTALK